MIHLVQAATVLLERAVRNEQLWRDSIVTFEVVGETEELYIGLSIGSLPNFEAKKCLPCIYQIITTVAVCECSSPLAGCCQRIQPKVNITRSVTSAYNGEPFIVNQIFVDGDPIKIDAIEFDIGFYLHYMDRFIESEEDLISFLKRFDASFGPNRWYQKSDNGWLHRLITDSKWNSAYLKALFGCLQHEDGLTFLESEELKKYGYEPLLRAFKIKYANTSASIVTDSDVANKLEAWVPRILFNDYIDRLFNEQIQKYKTRKKTYFDNDLKEWRTYDGSIEAKKKIFLSQFSRHPEFEAKRRIIQKLIRKAENEIRTEKGFTAVGTLVNEFILYSKLKDHFSSYNVMSQYRPKWLGRQSIDIYVEELKIGVEYQGDQHMRPVEFFGGFEAFEKTKQRDQKKWELCRRNGCRLIYVYPGYTFEEVVKQIIQISADG